MKNPIIKKGDIRKDNAGEEYEVLEVSNEYSEVSEYDHNGMCQEYSTDESLIALELDVDNILYCAVKKHMPNLERGKFLRAFVFLISRDSGILGE